jgi:predicted regulator of Ras-like GTPase activity (Roadblock/LC7/MglB family)
MATLPQLIEDDVQKLDAALAEFLEQTDATVALVIDKGGFVIAQQGSSADLDVTTIGALASGAFLASQTIAGLVNAKDFNHTALEGEHVSLFTVNVDEHCLMVAVFPSKAGIGVVKYYSGAVVRQLAHQLAIARERDPDGGFDLSVMNIADPQEIFRKKAA